MFGYLILLDAVPSFAPLATLGAAIIAAGASLTSAILTLKSKDRDFRNEYYKKIIDKRLSAYEAAERIAITLNLSVTAVIKRGLRDSQAKDIGELHLHFALSTPDKYFAFLNDIQASQAKIMWLSMSCGRKLVELQDAVQQVASDIDARVGVPVEEMAFVQALANRHELIDKARRGLLDAIRQEIPKMERVTAFFAELNSPL